jgi:hypothetical protein
MPGFQRRSVMKVLNELRHTQPVNKQAAKELSHRTPERLPKKQGYSFHKRTKKGALEAERERWMKK